MNPKTWSRRRFLASSSLVAGGLPLLSLLRSTKARAVGPVAPLRLVLLWSPFHVPEALYHPRASASSSAPADQGTAFSLDFPNSVLAPLAPFQSDLLIFRGLKYGDAPNSHGSGTTTFTGAVSTQVSGSDPVTTGSSIDNYLFGRMARQGSLSPFMAGAYSYLFGDHNFDAGISFSAGNPVGQIDNPLHLYNALFGSFTPPSTDPPSTSVVRARARRLQALSLVQTHLNGLMGRLPSTSSSYSVLQSHLAAAQGLSAQLNATAPPVGASCAPPLSTSISDDSGPDDGSFVPANAPADFASFTTVIAQALACDITRFGAFKMSDAGDPSQAIINQMPGLTDFDQNGNWHADVTHATTGDASNPLDVKLALFKRYFMSQVATLLSTLQSLADPFNPNQTLYDNTVVLIGSEGPVQSSGSDVHGNGDPNSDQPFVLAGGCGGHFNLGRLFFAGGATAGNVNHNALLTNIVNAFEANQQQVDPGFAPNILAQYGDFPFSVSPTTWLG